MARPRRTLLVSISIVWIAAGATGLVLGLAAAFTQAPALPAAAVPGAVRLGAALFCGVIMVSAGIIGLQQGVRTGAVTLGSLTLVCALIWMLLNLVTAAQTVLTPLLAAVSSVFYLAGVRLAYPG